jgi:hypothetical protein
LKLKIQNLKLKTVCIIFYYVSFFCVTNYVLADEDLSQSALEQLQAGGKKANYNVENTSDPREIVSMIIKGILGLTASISVALIIYAGFLYLTSRGDESQVEKAKNLLTAAIIGAVIVFAAYSISYFVGKSAVEVTNYGGQSVQFIE